MNKAPTFLFPKQDREHKKKDNEESHLFPQSKALITRHSDLQVNILYRNEQHLNYRNCRNLTLPKSAAVKLIPFLWKRIYTQIIPLQKQLANSKGAEENCIKTVLNKKLCSHLVAKNSTETVKV